MEYNMEYVEFIVEYLMYNHIKCITMLVWPPTIEIHSQKWRLTVTKWSQGIFGGVLLCKTKSLQIELCITQIQWL